MSFNENTRVKIPAILHLGRLGYSYLSLSNAIYDESTNIFTEIFKQSFSRINPDLDEDDIKRVFESVNLALENEDLGQVFFEKLDSLLLNKDPVKVEIAILFLNALGLGFRGKYRHFDNEDLLRNYRKRLFTFVNRRDPYLYDKKMHLFPDAYAHTLEGRVAKELPNLRNWYLIFLGIGAMTFAISSGVWD